MRRSALFDLYGELLTEKQRRCLSMSLLSDYSLSEIGEALGISRQAAHDTLRRSDEAMEAYEARLGLLAKEDATREIFAKIYGEIAALASPDAKKKREILRKLAPFAGREDEI